MRRVAMRPPVHKKKCYSSVGVRTGLRWVSAAWDGVPRSAATCWAARHEKAKALVSRNFSAGVGMDRGCLSCGSRIAMGMWCDIRIDEHIACTRDGLVRRTAQETARAAHAVARRLVADASDGRFTRKEPIVVCTRRWSAIISKQVTEKQSIHAAATTAAVRARTDPARDAASKDLAALPSRQCYALRLPDTSH